MKNFLTDLTTGAIFLALCGLIAGAISGVVIIGARYAPIVLGIAVFLLCSWLIGRAIR